MLELAGLQQLHWREPLWLLIALQPLLLALVVRLRRARHLRAYADPALQPWVVSRLQRPLLQRLVSRNAAYVVAWLLLGVAAAGPRLALQSSDPGSAGGRTILVAVDVSRSMEATDIRPSRIRRAQIEIAELLRTAGSDSVGLIVYAARAHLYVPPTADHGVIRAYLQDLDELVLPTRGSQAEKALRLALRELEQSAPPRAVVWMTDGDLPAEPQPALNDAVEALRQQAIPLYVLGLGTVEGAPVPLADGGWLQHDGRAVVSRMQERRLRGLAEAGGGRYSAVRDDASDWRTLYKEGIARHGPAPAAEASSKTAWRELYPYALLPAILLLFAARLPYSLARARLPVPVAALVGLLLFGPVDRLHAADHSAAQERAAHAAYVAKDFGAAASLYETVPGYAGRMGEGASHYRRGAYTKAVQAFGQAVLRAVTDHQRARALFNLGNAYFQVGDYANAVVAYNDALLYRPDYASARANGTLAEQLLREVRNRLGDTAVTERAGRGPRQARTDRPVELNNTASASLDEAEPPPPEDDRSPALPQPEQATMEQLIQRGLDRIRLASAESDRDGGDIAPIPTGQLAHAQSRMRELEQRNALLWKRLFEAEEGFPGPLDQPRPVPEVQPW